MDNLDIIDIVKRENGIDEDFYGDYFVDCMEELPSIEERFNKYMEIVQALKYYDDNDLVTPEKHLENMKNAINLLDGLIDNYCYSKEDDEYLLNKIIEENVFKDLLSCKHEDGKMASELVESFYNKNFSEIFTEYIKSYSANLENDEGVIASLITYKDEQGEIRYNAEFVNKICTKYLQTSNKIIPTELLIALSTYKGKDGKLYQGLEIPKDRFPQKTIEEIEEGEQHSISPILIRIENVSYLPVEKIEELEKKGVKIEGIILEHMPQYYNYKNPSLKNNGIINECNFYDLETYKKCRKRIDQYIKEANIDYENLKGTPNIDKIVFGKIIRMLSDISYDYSALDTEKENKWATSRNIVGGLLQGNCVCAGYAEIVRNIFSCYGIETETIAGMSKTEDGAGHAWNQIKLDGQWYNVDLTQAAGTIDELDPYYPGCSYGCVYLLKSDIVSQAKLVYNVEQPTHECLESIPSNEVHTYIFGTPEQIAELPVRGDYSKACTQKSTENIINNLISSVKSTELQQSKQIVLESVAEKSPKQEEMQR